MGIVYLAEQTVFAGRKLAVKQMDRLADPDEARRYAEQFLREAQLLGSLTHPNLVEVKDYFEEDETLYLVMEFVEGQSLESMMRHRGEPFPVDLVVQWMREVLAVLHYLHTHDPAIVFQDLKPSNLMLETGGRIRLIDFGIARTMDPSTRTITLTRGAGTPGYAAPEQHGGMASTVADIYSAGATMYALLSARVPPPSLHLLLGSAELSPLSALNPQVMPMLEEVIHHMMALLAANRFQSVAEVMAALEAALTGPPTRKPALAGSSTGKMEKESKDKANSPLLRRPSDGLWIKTDSEKGAIPAASSGPELQVKRPPSRKVTPSPQTTPAPHGGRSRTCPGCGSQLEPGQICPRCMPQSQPQPVVPPRPPKIHDPLSERPKQEERRPMLAGLFRREATNKLNSVPRPVILPDDGEESVIRVVSYQNSSVSFESSEWLELGTPLTLGLGLVKDGNLISHCSVPVVPQSVVASEKALFYVVDILKELPQDMGRFLNMFQGVLPTEQRREPRYPCRFKVTSPDLPTYQAISANVSSHGLALLTAGPVTVGRKVTLRLDFDDDRFTFVICRNIVRWCLYPSEGSHQIGTELSEINPEHAATLQGYVDFIGGTKERWRP
jgi:serine/threonine-protein kinase